MRDLVGALALENAASPIAGTHIIAILDGELVAHLRGLQILLAESLPPVMDELHEGGSKLAVGHSIGRIDSSGVRLVPKTVEWCKILITSYTQN